MNKTPRIYAMIVAAGQGSRFGASLPKQYVLLQNQTLLQHSVARLAQSAYIDDCLLVLAADDSTAQTLDFALPIYHTIGGAERWQSVFAGVEAIIQAGAADTDLILIHDAARPAVPCVDIDNVIEAAIHEPYGAILATPVADTLKQSQLKPNSHSSMQTNPTSHYYTTHSVDRSDMWQAQTPQVFRVAQLKQALTYVATHKLMITDEASAFEQLQLPIRLVMGSRQNIKLTYPDDDRLLCAILNAYLG